VSIPRTLQELTVTQPPPPSSPSGPLAPQPAGWNQPGPQPGGGWNQPAPAPAKKPSKAPKVLIILGAVVLALSLVIGIVVAVIGFGGVASGASKFEVFESGSGTYTAEADETVQLFAEEGVPAPECMIDGPAVGEGTIQTSSYGDGERQWESFRSFTAEQAGDYTIDCGGTPVMVGPPISIGGIFAGLGGIFLAIGGGLLGILLLVIGVIILLVRRSRA
jgi:hypothetical protein